jgi:8-oxo-(d)GTP phosphatase
MRLERALGCDTSGVGSPEIVAAGAVVGRRGSQVLLVHRPKYDDWSFPKGKLDPGEHALAAAVREVAEETGLQVRLGPPLPDQWYDVRNGSVRRKRVHYWAGRVVGDDDVSAYRPNDEVDELAWLPTEEARERLSYERDRAILAAYLPVRKRSTPLVVLRHAKAHPRKAWSGDDQERPLSAAGELQAEHLAPLLDAYGVTRVVSSSSRRCWTTVAPYAETRGLPLELTETLSEEAADARGVEEAVRDLLGGKEPAVLCTHRPVLPLVLEPLGRNDPHLDAGSFLVAHHRHGRVVDTELHTV